MVTNVAAAGFLAAEIPSRNAISAARGASDGGSSLGNSSEQSRVAENKMQQSLDLVTIAGEIN